MQVDGADAVGGKLPPGSPLPRLVQDLAYLTVGRRLMAYMAKKYGTAFCMRLPGFGPGVVISDAALVRQLLQYPPDAIQGVEPNLSVVTGPGSMFGLQDQTHLKRRKLLTPPFHGKRMRLYDVIIEDETRKEMATWPEGEEFPMLPSAMRITLNTILRAIFGAEGEEFATLRILLPKALDLGSRLALMPWMRVDLGRWSPWRRFLVMREELHETCETLIAKAEADPDLASRQDVLALMVQARYDDGSAMSHREIAEELIGLTAAGNETTAITVAWAFERLRRHPGLLSRLVAEIDSGESTLLHATVTETLRVRAPIDAAARQVIAPSIELGDWVIPRGYTVAINIGLSHLNEAQFADPERFDPDRFIGETPKPYALVPFGGGVRRCPGASFAEMETAVVLRTILRDYTVEPSSARGERWRSRGVAFAPARGGQVMVTRRAKHPSVDGMTAGAVG